MHRLRKKKSIFLKNIKYEYDMRIKIEKYALFPEN